MANILRGGFHPRKGINAVPKPRRYEVASSYGTALFPGDVVTLVTAGTVEACTAGGAPLILGVIAHVSYVSNNKRIYGQYIPATTVYAPTTRGSANASYAYVWDDPSIEYIASVSSHADTDTAAEVYAAVGSNMDLVATAGSTVYGRSGHTLDGNEVAATAQFRIVEIIRDPANDLTSANFRVACMINEGFHVLTSAAGI
jgi:hypothetical protein